MVVELGAGAAVEVVEVTAEVAVVDVTAAVDDDAAADGLADVVDGLVLVLQLVSNSVVTITMLNSARTFWRHKTAGRVLLLNNLIRFLPISNLPPFIYSFLKIHSTFYLLAVENFYMRS